MLKQITMKNHILLSIVLLILLVGYSADTFAQCTPNPAYTNVGIYPNPFPPACVGNYFEQVVYFTFPDDTTVTYPPYGTFTIPYDSFRIVNVSNLPPGLSYTCGTPNCTFEPTALGQHTFGCALIYGTPSTATTPADSVDITVTAWLTVPVLGVQSGSSIIRVHMSVTTIYITPVDLSICQGDSAFLQGDYQTVPGVYLDTFSTIGVCDSIVVTDLSVNNLSNAGVSSTDSICSNLSNILLFDLIDGTPDPGGLWIDLDASGALSAGVFNATAVLPGVYHFIYVAQNAPCDPDSSELTLVVYDCGIGYGEFNNLANFRLFPNPCNGVVELALNQNLSGSTLMIFNINGSLQSSHVLGSDLIQKIYVPSSPGFYLVKIIDQCGNLKGNQILMVE